MPLKKYKKALQTKAFVYYEAWNNRKHKLTNYFVNFVKKKQLFCWEDMILVGCFLFTDLVRLAHLL